MFVCFFFGLLKMNWREQKNQTRNNNVFFNKTITATTTKEQE